MNIDEAKLVEIIKQVIREQEAFKPQFTKHVDKSGVISVKAQEVKCEKFTDQKESDKVYLTDILTLEESPRLGCGVMELDNTSFEWTLTYDEVDYVIEGTLEIIIDGNRISADKGEVIFIPKNSKIRFSSPNKARFLYVTYPANWAES